MNQYEVTLVIKPDVDATNMTALMDKVKEILTADGGAITKTDVWGTRKLGYPIRKFTQGQYVFMMCDLEPAALKRIEQRIRLNEDIIRHLVVKYEEVKPQKVRKPKAAAEAAPEAVAEPVAQPAAE